MRLLVTGGAGYIGSVAVRRFLERGDDVVVLDSLVQGHAAAVGSAQLVVGDVRERPLVEAILRERAVDAVVHFAALKSVDESMHDPGAYFDANVAGTVAVLEAMAAVGVGRIVFSSSCAIYGTPRRLPVDEAAEPDPDNPYGETKLLAERMLRWYDRIRDIRFAALRYFNAAGAWPDGGVGEDWRGAQTLVPNAIRAAMGLGPPLRVFGTDYATPDGTAIRDYIHVLDLVDAHVAAVDRLAAGGGSLTANLGTARGNSVRDVIRAVERVGGRPVPLEPAERRPGDPAEIWADPSLARRLLAWEARYDLDEMVASAWAWHDRHPHGWEVVPKRDGPPEAGAGRAGL